MKFLLLIALTAACNNTVAPTESFTNVFSLLRKQQGFLFVLCLDNSTTEQRFSLGKRVTLSITHLVLQYFSRRSAGSVQQTLWVRELFSWAVQGSLTLRNVRVSGQKLIKENCEEEWCTHCLVAPYLWPGLNNQTVIEKHPAVDQTDSSYSLFQCTHDPFSFFEVANAIMIIESASFDNIRIRATHFIHLEGRANLTISQTNITRMDFTEGFLGGIAQDVLLCDLYISGFNRDHAYARSYSGDSGLLQLTKVGNLTLVRSLFEDSLQLNSVNTDPISTIYLENFYHVIIAFCVFRSTMSGLLLSNRDSAQLLSTALITECVFEENFIINIAIVAFYSSTPAKIVMSKCTFKSNTALFYAFIDILLYRNSALQFTDCQFIDNHVYVPVSSKLFPSIPVIILCDTVASVAIENTIWMDSDRDYKQTPNLISQLVEAQLLLPSPDLSTDFLESPPQDYTSFLELWSWFQVHLTNITFHNCLNFQKGLHFNSLLAANGTILLDHLTMNNVNFEIGVQVEAFRDFAFTVFLSDSSFHGTGQVFNLENFDASITIYISNCLFANNTASEPSVQIAGATVQILHSQFEASAGGAVLFSLTHHSEERLVVNESDFRNNTATLGVGDILIVSGTFRASLSLEISNTRFQDFSGAIGGSIYLENVLLKKATIRTCNFTGGSAASRTGVIVARHAGGLLVLEEIYFSGYANPDSFLIQINTPSTSAQEKLTKLLGIHVKNCAYLAAVKLEGQLMQTFVETANCSFIDNQGIVIWSDVAALSDSKSLFQTNTAEGYPCYFQDQQSSATFENTQFIGNSATAKPGGCLYLRGRTSTATFSNCVFQNNAASAGGAMRVEQFATVEIYNSSFAHNAASQGSAMYLLNAAVPLHIARTFFEENYGEGVIYLMNSKLSLEDVSLVRNSGPNTGGLVLVRSEVSASKSVFSELTGEQGCVVSMSQSSSMTWEACQAQDVNCSGNLIDLLQDSSLRLTSCRLLNLASNANIISIQEGRNFEAFSLIVRNISAVSFLSVTQTNVTVQGSVLSDLKALVFCSNDSYVFALSNSSLSNVSTSESGFLSCSRVRSVELLNLKVSHVRGGQMGASMTESEVHIEGCTFQAVRAYNYGVLFFEDSKLNLIHSSFLSNRALAAHSMGGALTLSNSSAIISNCLFSANIAYRGGAIYSSTTIKLQDNVFENNRAFYGPVIASYTHKLHIVNTSSLVFASGQLFKGPLVAGLLDKRNQLVQVESSLHWLDDSTLSGNLVAKAERGLLKFSNFAVNGPPGQQVSIHLAGASVILRLRNCIAGEIKEEGLCEPCPFSTYSVDFTDCAKCPSGGDCPGDGNIYPKQGYWRPSQSFNGVFACANAEACKGHENYTSSTGHCAEPYEDNLCQKCKAGASRSGQDTCKSCPTLMTNYLSLVTVGLGTTLFITFLVRSALRSARQKASQAGTALKILLNYVQIITLVARFPLSWPAELEAFFSFHEYTGNSGEQYLSLDCLLPDPYSTKMIVLALLPFTLVLLNAMLWLLIWGAAQLFHRSLRVQEKCICSTVVSLFYVHSLITRTTFSAFQCSTILPGEHWLKVEMSIRCWKGQHSFIALGVALPAIVLWGIGIPTLALLLLVKYRKRLREYRVKEAVNFLYANYKPKFFFWEVAIIYKKVIVVVMLTLLNNFGPAIQNLALALLLSASALLQFNHVPFKSIPLNRCQLLSEVAILLTIYAGLYFRFEFLSIGVRICLIALAISVNSAFLFYLIAALLRFKVRRWLPRGMQINNILRSPHKLKQATKTRNLVKLQAQSHFLYFQDQLRTID